MTRVDPFEHLPKEIAGLIFDFIPEQRWRCMSVSRTWRNFILNIPVAHLAIDLRKWPLNPDSRRGLVLLLMTRPQSLSWMCSEASLCELVAMLNRAECFQLRKLDTLSTSSRCISHIMLYSLRIARA
ncbi:hypothetical protein BCR43DRAFT_133936 [Syncephalastrum racemosum]|uniref:F-box domain-containing protein n=1 Tax=Syncephalastrum racemosum TaxID=13706 RepID=A0A1X2HMY0_SYNRA|nr:hypothetical protein BCR43DRAFT_133936 [Syncephalastrum racemosum]